MAAVVTVVLVGEDAQLRAALKRVQTETAKVSARFATMAKGSSRALTDTGKMLTHLTLPAIAVGVAATKMGYDFETAVNKVDKLAGGVGISIGKLKDDLLSMSAEVGQAPTELAKGLYPIAADGFKGATALDILRVSAKGAALGMGTTKDVADVVTSVMNTYGEQNITAAQTVDTLTAALQHGKAQPEAYAKELGKVLPIALDTRVAFDQIVGAIAALSQKGEDVPQATTALRAMLTEFLKPSAGARTEMKALGSSWSQLRKQLAVQGILPTLQHIMQLSAKGVKTPFNPAEFKQLSQTLGITGKELKRMIGSADLTKVAKLFPNVRALTGVIALAGSSARQTKKAMDGVHDSAGALDKAFKAWASTSQGKLHLAMTALKADMTRLGVTLLPKIAVAVRAVSQWWNHLSADTKKSILVFIGLNAALGPILYTMGKLLKLLSLFAKHPVVATVFLLAEGLIYLYSTNESFRKTVNGVLGGLGKYSGLLKAIGAGIATFIAVAGTGMAITKAWAAATAVATFVTGGWVTSFWALDAAMAANPVGAIILGVAALSAAVVFCYKKFDHFRYVVNMVVKIVVTTIATMAVAWLDVWGAIFGVLGKLPGKFGAPFRKVGDYIDTAKSKVWGLRDAVEALPTSKTMDIQIRISTIQQTYEAHDPTTGAPVGYGANARMMEAATGTNKVAQQAENAAAQAKAAGKKIGNSLKSGITSGLSNYNGGSDGGGGGGGGGAGGAAKKAAADAAKAAASAFKAAAKQVNASNFAAALIGSPDKITSTLGALIDHLKAAGRKDIASLVASSEKDILAAAKKRDALLAKIKAAQQVVTDKQKVSSDYAKSIRDAVDSTASLGANDGHFVTYARIQRKLQKALADAQAFKGVITDLTRKGLGKAALQQVIDAGPEQGVRIGKAILAAGQAAITGKGGINDIQNQIDSAGASVGQATADHFFKAGVNAAAGIVKGLQSQEAAIAKSMDHMATLLVNSLKKKLKIKSPSQVFHELGRFIVHGLANGITAAGRLATDAAAKVSKGIVFTGSTDLAARSANLSGRISSASAALGGSTPARSVALPAQAGVSTTNQVTVNATTNADPHRIAHEVSWQLRTVSA